MAINPELLSWLKIIAGSSATGGALVGAARWFIVRPVRRAEANELRAQREADQYKKLLKEEFVAREKRIAAQETALFGRPSSRPQAPYREELPTLSAIVNNTNSVRREEELQRKMLEARARELPKSTVLEALAPPRPHRPKLHGTQLDYEEFRKSQRDPATAATPTQAFRLDRLGAIFPPPKKDEEP